MKWFKEDDFKCRCKTNNGESCGFDAPKWFKNDVDNARGFAGVPFYLTSAARCPIHNKNEGGSETSTHIEALAVDISYTDTLNMIKIVCGLKDAGFVRTGVNEKKKFIHADKSLTKPPAIFKY